MKERACQFTSISEAETLLALTPAGFSLGSENRQRETELCRRLPKAQKRTEQISSIFTFITVRILLISTQMNHHTQVLLVNWLTLHYTQRHPPPPHPTPFSILRGSTDLNANQFLLWRSILIQRWYLKAICWFVHKCVPMILYLVHIKIFLQIYFSACVFIYRAVLIQSDKKTKKSTLGALLRFHSRPPFYLSPQSRWWPRGWRDPVLCCCKCQP